MTTMTRIRIGDADHYVSPNVAREIDSLRGQNAALTAMVQGKVQMPAAQPVTDAVTATRLAARDAIRAEEAANRDPKTPRGAYRAWLENAWRNGGVGERA